MEALKQIQPGDDSLIFAEQANKLIDAINTWIAMKIIPDGVGTVKIEEGSMVIDLNPIGFPTPPKPGTYVLTAIDGVLTWTATTECPA